LFVYIKLGSFLTRLISATKLTKHEKGGNEVLC
jgi:hypothetical protein